MATYLDEGMDIVSAMPGEVQRAMALIRDLDSGSTKLLDALKRKQTDYIKRVQDAVKDKPRTPGTDLRALSMDKEALAEIEAMREEVLQKSEEKVSVAEQARFVLAETLEGLDKHLLGFEQHLRSSGVFDPHGLPKDTPLADDGYGAGGSQAKRARVEVGRDAGGYGAAGGAGTGSAAIHASQYAGTSSSSQAAAAAPGHHGASAGTTAGAQSSMQGGGAGGGGYGNSSAVEQASRDAAARAAAAMARETSAAAAYAAAPAQVAAGAAGTAAAAAAPSEEQYCLCNGPSFGEMVGCDNDACTTGNGWFHLACVHLTAPPPEHVQWFCPTCKAAMDSKARRRK